ncbi:MAG: energy-coupling factor transporter transmembrane protein EcfT [Planctomycetia bacterium]|nr:energy-coupling factor transporter transmembrane protein EcfT [Planctomycetia bacterium]
MSSALFTPTNARAWLARLDPRVKLLYVFGISVAAAVVQSLDELGVLFATAIFFSTGLRLPARGWGAILGILALTVWGTMLTQGFFYSFEPRTPLLTLVAPRGTGGDRFAGVVLTVEGLRYGAMQSLRLLATALAGFTVSLSTSPERMLAALSWFRLPTTLSFMTTAALRFLPLLIEEAIEVRQARKLRGYRFRIWGMPGDRFGSYRAELGILLPVIAAALRKAETLAESVTARGFDPYRPRTFYPPLAMRGWEKIVAAVLAGGSAALLVYGIGLL